MKEKKTWFSTQKELIEARLKTLTRRNKILILVLTVVLIGGGFWYFFYKPNNEKIITKQREIEEAKKRLDQLKQAALRVNQVQKQLDEIDEKLQDLLVYLPDIKEIPSLLETISGTGSKVGLKQIVLFEPGAEELREFHTAIPIRLHLVGNFHNLGSFYDELAQIKRVVKVRLFEIKRKGEGEVDVNCVVETYRYLEKPPEQPPKGKK